VRGSIQPRQGPAARQFPAWSHRIP
jgi:hypothetical protein